MARPTKKYNLSAVEAETKLKKPMIEIELRTGKTVTIEPPELWPDEVADLASVGKMTEMAKILLGDQYQVFKDGGGTTALLSAIIAEHTGQNVGESPAS